MKWSNKKVAMYLPVDKGLLFSDIIKVCKDPLNATVLTKLHPLQRAGTAGFAVPMTNSDDGIDIFRMKICSSFRRATAQPWVADDWKDWNADNSDIYSQHVVPAMRTKGMYRGHMYRGTIKCEMCHDMPNDVATAMQEAFARAGFGKPSRVPKPYDAVTGDF
jgi:hypothetical protein